MALRAKCCDRILSLIAHLRLVDDGEQPATVLRQQTHGLLPDLLRQVRALRCLRKRTEQVELTARL
uniref:Uncharacterized protein n=1 Tax=Paraburkholderia sprentiae WSM5005 TaxID=754502 RepID=A0A1I9YWI1_9BURK